MAREDQYSVHRSPLSIRDSTYAKGIGMRAPANLLYEIQPGYESFVARAGIDDDPFRERPNARFLATYPRVRFHVYIDGNLAAESPIMRLSQERWRFDVKIPAQSRLINLVVTDSASRSPLDLANWVDAGFVLKRSVFDAVFILHDHTLVAGYCNVCQSFFAPRQSGRQVRPQDSILGAKYSFCSSSS
jgi:hypothetical protein